MPILRCSDSTMFRPPIITFVISVASTQSRAFPGRNTTTARDQCLWRWPTLSQSTASISRNRMGNGPQVLLVTVFDSDLSRWEISKFAKSWEQVPVASVHILVHRCRPQCIPEYIHTHREVIGNIPQKVSYQQDSVESIESTYRPMRYDPSQCVDDPQRRAPRYWRHRHCGAIHWHELRLELWIDRLEFSKTDPYRRLTYREPSKSLLRVILPGMMIVFFLLRLVTKRPIPSFRSDNWPRRVEKASLATAARTTTVRVAVARKAITLKISETIPGKNLLIFLCFVPCFNNAFNNRHTFDDDTTVMHFVMD